ncbi:MAG: hypothetical protein ABI091_05055 [Ferruginibacter sp.]
MIWENDLMLYVNGTSKIFTVATYPVTYNNEPDWICIMVKEINHNYGLIDRFEFYYNTVNHKIDSVLDSKPAIIIVAEMEKMVKLGFEKWI